MAGAFTSAAGAMYQGQKGLKAFDGAIDKTADALMILTGALALIGGPITLLAAGLTAAVGAGAKYVKAANEQSDKLFEAYRGMAQAGAAAQDGLQGLYNDVKRLGGGIQDLDEFVNLIASSAQSLASFRGTVFDGRKEFAKMAHEMKPFRLGMEQAGISQKAQNEATMSYIRLQSRVGLTQNKSVVDLAESARKYIYEQDRLTKLTGLNAKEQEDLKMSARNKETFAATLLELRNRGDEKSIQAAKNLENTFVVLSQHSKEFGEGLLDETLRTEAAQKLYRLTAGESLRVQQELKEGLITDVQALDRLAKATDNFINSQGVSMGRLGNVANFAGDLAGAISFVAAGTRGFEKSLAKATKAQEEQALFGGTALDDEVNTQAKLRLTQVDAMQNMQDFVRRGVTPATKATEFFGRVIEKTTKMFKGSDSLAKDYDAERLVQQRQEKVSEAYENLMNARTAVELAEEKGTAEDQKIKNEELKAAKEKFAAAVAERKAAEQALQDLRTGKKSVGTTSVGTTTPIPTTSVTSGSGTSGAIAKGTQQLLNPKDVIAEPTLAQLQSSQAYIAARRSGIGAKAALQAAKDSFSASSKASSSTYPSSGPTSAAQPAAGADGKTSSPEQSGGAPSSGAGKTVGEAPIASIVDSRPGEITVATTDGQKQKRQGAANWRMNNPGNLRMTSWTKGQGGVVGEGDAGPSGKFAVFSTLADGRRAKENLLFSGNTVYGNLDLRGAMYKYAPPSDNNPTESYLQSILQATGASATTKLAEMSQNQRDSMLAAIEKFEGFKPGKIYAAAEGGIVREKLGGTMVWAGEAGQDEAVVPLKNGNIPVSFTGTDSIAEALGRITDEFKSSLNQMVNSMRNNQQSVLNEEALEILRGIESATKNSSSIQDQMLRVAQN
jgi:hypothetical protein